MLRQWSKPCTIFGFSPVAWTQAHMRKLCSDVRRKVKDENACSLSLSLYLFLAQSADRKHMTWLLRHLATCLKGLEGEENITQVLIKCEQHLERGTKGHRSSISETRGYFTIHCLVTSQINQWTQNVPLLVLQTCFGTCWCYNLDLYALSAVVAKVKCYGEITLRMKGSEQWCSGLLLSLA